MLKTIIVEKTDPIFATIEAHRRSVAERCAIVDALNGMGACAPERSEAEKAYGKAMSLEMAATRKLRTTVSTTIAGVAAMITYFVEHQDRYFDWRGGAAQSRPGSVAYPNEISFEACIMRNCASTRNQSEVTRLLIRRKYLLLVFAWFTVPFATHVPGKANTRALARLWT